MSPDYEPPEQRDRRLPRRPTPGQGWPRWGTWLVLGVILALFVVGSMFTTSSSNKITYSQFLDRVRDHKVESVSIDNSSHSISGVDTDGSHFKVSGPDPVPSEDLDVLRNSGVKYDFKTSTPNFFVSLLPYLLPMGLLILFFVWMNRRAQGQVGRGHQPRRSGRGDRADPDGEAGRGRAGNPPGDERDQNVYAI